MPRFSLKKNSKKNSIFFIFVSAGSSLPSLYVIFVSSSRDTCTQNTPILFRWITQKIGKNCTNNKHEKINKYPITHNEDTTTCPIYQYARIHFTERMRMYHVIAFITLSIFFFVNTFCWKRSAQVLKWYNLSDLISLPL